MGLKLGTDPDKYMIIQADLCLNQVLRELRSFNMGGDEVVRFEKQIRKLKMLFSQQDYIQYITSYFYSSQHQTSQSHETC